MHTTPPAVEEPTAEPRNRQERRHGRKPEWLDNAGVAERYDVSVHTVRGWRRRRMGPPAHKIGGKVLYRLDELEEWERDHSDRPDRIAG